MSTVQLMGDIPKSSLVIIPLVITLACQDAAVVDEQRQLQTPVQMEVVSGQNQVGAAGSELSDPLVVKVVNGSGQAVPNQVVNFQVVEGGGSTYAGTALTNLAGLAQERWTLGSAPGASQKIEARAVDSGTGQKLVFATFSATALDPAQAVATVTVAPTSTNLAVGATQQLTATARNSSGTVLSGKTFSWSSSNTTVATVSGAGLVTGRAGGSATITASSEGKNGTATIVVTAAPPPVSSDTIFYEGFEAGTLDEWTDGFNAANHTVLNNATTAYAGTHLLRMTVPANSEGSHLAHFFMPGYDSVFVRLHVRYASNWTGNTYIALLRGSRTDDPYSSFGVAGQCPTGNDWFATNVTTTGSGNPGATQFFSFWVGMPKEADGVTCLGRHGNGTETYYPQTALTRNEWHRVEFWVKLDTPAGSNAIQKMWIDGQLRGEWNGLNFRTTTNLKLNSLSIVAYPDAVSTVARTLFYDEIVVTRAPLPGSFGDPPPPPPPPPPPAPVATVTVSPATFSLAVGATRQMSATLRDANGNTLTGRTVSWSSSNAVVATVSTSGLVTARAAGNATITATSEGKSGAASVTVTQSTGFAAPDILDHDFDNGTWGPFFNPFGSDLAVVADPTGRLSGNVARINFNLGPGSPDHQDRNRFFEANIGSQNRSHVFVRCDFVVETPTGNNPLISRKMIYFKSPSYPSGNGWAVVVYIDDPAPNARNELWTTYGELNFQPTGHGYFVQNDRRYTMEAEIKRNTSPGTSDGLIRVWLTNEAGTTTLAAQRTNIRIATQTTEPIQLIEIGRQVDRFSSSDNVQERRFWDRCAISSKRIGP